MIQEGRTCPRGHLGIAGSWWPRVSWVTRHASLAVIAFDLVEKAEDLGNAPAELPDAGCIFSPLYLGCRTSGLANT